MASVHSVRENTFLGDLSSGETWIGGKRVCLTCDEWTWTDGTPWDFVNWRIRGAEPDNKQGKENIWVLMEATQTTGGLTMGLMLMRQSPLSVLKYLKRTECGRV